MLHVVAGEHNIVQALLDNMFMTYLIWNKLFMLFFVARWFSQKKKLKKYFNNNVRMSNSLDPDRARLFCRAWSGSKPLAAIYPRLVEFLHFDIQSTGQKSHCVNTSETGIAMLIF